LPVFVIPFSIFFACCAAQFFFLDRIKRSLSARHPDVLQSLVGKSFFSFSNNAITKFAWKRRDLSLNDPELTKRVKQFKILLFVAYGALGLLALALITGVANQPLSLDWLFGNTARSSVHAQPGSISTAPNLPASGMTPTFGIVFAAAYLGNVIYLVLAWRLSIRWNSLCLGATATLGDPLGVLGVIWWSKPAMRDEAFLRLRIVTRTVFVLALAGTFTVFGLVFLMAR
jgi:hypothetical protein